MWLVNAHLFCRLRHDAQAAGMVDDPQEGG
jgi:hypothetical protein